MIGKLTSLFAKLSDHGYRHWDAFQYRKRLDPHTLETLYHSPLIAPKKPLKVFHLGHSLVGVDMPCMLQQLAGAEHRFHSQLGWGATLKSHWEPDVPVPGFESCNDHHAYRAVDKAIASQEYDAFVMTEMVEIRDAIQYYSSPKYLAKFINKLLELSPGTRIYFYETWHEVTDPEGWRYRLQRDLAEYWEGEILYKALASLSKPVPVYVIPAGQVFARFFEEVEKCGGVEGISSPEAIFGTHPDTGEFDPIHLNDIGNYLVALVHFAVLYHKSPEGLPHQLKRFDGKEAMAPSAEATALMQKITWEVVRRYPKTGVKQSQSE